MRKKLYLIVFGLYPILVSAQTDDVPSQLDKYGVTLIDLTLHAQPIPTDYAFDMTAETPDPEYPVTYKATYDPSRSTPWEMTSWNGKKPEKYQKRVLKDRAKDLPTEKMKVDEASLASVTEGDYLIVSFRVVSETVPKMYKYLEACDGKAYINTTNGLFEKTVWTNFEPTRNGIVKVKNMREEITFIKVDDRYFVEKISQQMGGSVDTKIGNLSNEVSQITTYSNYRKL